MSQRRTQASPKSSVIAVIGSTIALSIMLLHANPTLAIDANSQQKDTLKRNATWEQLTNEEKAALLRRSFNEAGLSKQQIDPTLARLAKQLADDREDPLDLYVTGIRGLLPKIETIAEEILQACQANDPKQIQSSLETGSDEVMKALPNAISDTFLTWIGRELARQRFYDEALSALDSIAPEKSIDPATALFFRGVCHHALLNKEDALGDLSRLLENEEACPTRYLRTAKMMVADLQPLKKDSLDEISRIMSDVSRRLDLGRSGTQVRDQEQKIIDKLDRLIDELEQQQQKQQQQQQQSNSGQGGGQQGGQGSPMNDSKIAGGGGNGDVDRKNIEQRDGWGNLPPAERQEAIQQISRDLPTHYREAIEAYFRKLATDKN
ncbi:hypothetical protein OAL35_01365 [bacterium]|nr:hypothetical protein [bacterium]